MKILLYWILARFYIKVKAVLLKLVVNHLSFFLEKKIQFKITVFLKHEN